MEPDQVLPATEAERLAFADLLAELDVAEWSADSLCRGWTVQDVAAHVTMATRVSMIPAVVGLIRARGDPDRIIEDAARQKAAAVGPGEIVRQLREDAGSARRPPGTKIWDPLVNVLVHAQDVARPLGREHPMPLDRVEPALRHVWATSGYGAAKRFRGLRFAAVDTDWRAGARDRCGEGPAADLLMLLTGRAAGLAHVEGPGREKAARRIDA